MTLTDHEQKTLARIEAAADAGERAPLNGDICATAIRSLTDKGYLRVEIYSKNWRVIEILGSSKRTTECPFGCGRPYRVFGGNGGGPKLAPKKKIPSAAEREAVARAATRSNFYD